MEKDSYIIYVETFGKVQSGTKIEDKNYRRGSVEFNEWGKVAIALAADDAKKNITMRPKTAFYEEVKRLLK